jgi:hypothetical protein
MSTPTFADWHAINHLLMVYAEHVDAGRHDEVGRLFAHGVYRIEHAGSEHVTQYAGAVEVAAFCEAVLIHSDGTPRTKHVVSNVDIGVAGEQGWASSYVTVFQQAGPLPLQPIASGRYRDRFVRADGAWRFDERTVAGFLLGDRSQHIEWHAGVPASSS